MVSKMKANSPARYAHRSGGPKKRRGKVFCSNTKGDISVNVDNIICNNVYGAALSCGNNNNENNNMFSSPSSPSLSPSSNQANSIGYFPATTANIIPTADDYANLSFCSVDCESDDDKDDLFKNESICVPVVPASFQNHTSNNNDTSCTPSQSRRRRHPQLLHQNRLQLQPQHYQRHCHNSNNSSHHVSFCPSPPKIHHISNLPPAHSMTMEEKELLWFSPNELEASKTSAQTAILQMRIIAAEGIANATVTAINAAATTTTTNNKINAPGTKNDKNSKNRKNKGNNEITIDTKFRKTMLRFEKDTHQSIRGLEHRLFRRNYNKQTRKSLIKDVLECQKHIQTLSHKFDYDIGSDDAYMLLANVSIKRSKQAINSALDAAMVDFREVYCDGADDDGYASSLSLSLGSQLLSLPSSSSSHSSSSSCSSKKYIAKIPSHSFNSMF